MLQLLAGAPIKLVHFISPADGLGTGKTLDTSLRTPSRAPPGARAWRLPWRS